MLTSEAAQYASTSSTKPGHQCSVRNSVNRGKCKLHVTDLVNIFESFLPQLLRYPNPKDPLNGEAAALLMENEESYNRRVRDNTAKYASEDIIMDDEDRKVSSGDTTNSTISEEIAVEDDDNMSQVSDMSDF